MKKHLMKIYMLVYVILMSLFSVGCQKECRLADLSGKGMFYVDRNIKLLRDGEADTLVGLYEYKYEGRVDVIDIVPGDVDTAVYRMVYTPRDTAVVRGVYHCDYKYLENIYFFDTCAADPYHGWIGLGVIEDYGTFFDIAIGKDSVAVADDGSVVSYRVTDRVKCVF